MGARGVRPVTFYVGREHRDALELVRAIPGVLTFPGRVLAAWDIAWRVAELLNIEPPSEPTEAGVEAPGLARYEALGFKDKLWTHQKEGVLFLLRRSWALLGLPMRTGKTPTALAADVAVDSRHTLVVAPSLVKWVWAAEIAKWTGEAALILEGRSGREAKRYCLTCKGRGLTPAGDWCSACRQLNGQSYGYEIVEVRRVSKPLRAVRADLPKPRGNLYQRVHARPGAPGARVNLLRPRVMGPTYPRHCDMPAMREARAVYYGALDTGEYQCSKHSEVRSYDKTALCLRCRDELLAAIRTSRYVITNYDILIAQEHIMEDGVEAGVRLDLPGWSPVLARTSFDVAILDEGHVLRGRPEKKRRGKSRRDRLAHALTAVPRVWILTGTPIYGYTRDLFGPFDIASKGLFGRTHYKFDEAYCEGRTNSYGGWVADGRSILAETELGPRLARVMLKKERSEILPDMPPKIRQVVDIEPKGPLPRVARLDSRKSSIKRALSATLEHKLDTIVEQVVDGMAEGLGILVFTFIKDNAETVLHAVEAEMRNPTRRTRMRQVSATTWLAHGSVNDKARVDMAQDFREHVAAGNAGLFVSTIDAMQVGVSLRGAAMLHYAELHWSPAAMLQSEDRPYEVGVQGLTIVYHKLKGSIDEHVLSILLPKFETQSVLTGEEGAVDARRALGGDAGEEETIDDIWARLTAHLESEDE